MLTGSIPYASPFSTITSSPDGLEKAAPVRGGAAVSSPGS